MVAFRDAFCEQLGSLIEEVVVGTGPCGELRWVLLEVPICDVHVESEFCRVFEGFISTHPHSCIGQVCSVAFVGSKAVLLL